MIKIWLFSYRHHLKQILTGFHLLSSYEGDKIKIYDKRHFAKSNGIDTIACLVFYNNKKIIYDMQDGYQDEESMIKLLNDCDIYFKRSFSRIENNKLNEKVGHKITNKMFPLSFNYDVTYQWSPLNDCVWWKEKIRKIFGKEKTPYAYFCPSIIECKPSYNGGKPKIFFQTKCWEIYDNYPDWKKKQWEYINNMRINIVRRLKMEFPEQFDGGLVDSKIDRLLAPDLIIPNEYTDRKEYIKRMKKADICIGTTGLHMSIGGKSGEYVAASKAIIHENFYYEVSGNFEEGKNYLAFSTEDECVENVKKLIDNPELIYKMQRNNYEYYMEFVEPYRLVANSLDIVDEKNN